MKIVKKIIPYVLILIMVVLIRTFLITPAIVNGDSMENTLSDGDVVIVNKIYLTLSSPRRFDIVVIEENGEKIVKRVVGMPGEKVEYKNNRLYINGRGILSELTFQETDDFVYEKVEDGTYFVLGDNRSVSKDSRTLGTIKKEKIIGKVSLAIFPFSRLGLVK